MADVKAFLCEQGMKHDEDFVNEVYFASGGNIGTVA